MCLWLRSVRKLLAASECHEILVGKASTIGEILSQSRIKRGLLPMGLQLLSVFFCVKSSGIMSSGGGNLSAFG